MPSVGETEFFGAPIFDATGSLVTSGTATIKFLIEDSGTKYLQGDLTTMSATPNTINATHDTDYDAHGITLAIPESMRGETVTWVLEDFASDGVSVGRFEVSEGAGDGDGDGITVSIE